ncbi:MAG: PA0069 family radical SAM protein [Planctomycetota bacterium]|jgi:DNA repair photolyase
MEYPDRLKFGLARGRGAALNPANRFDRVQLCVDGETLDAARDEAPGGRQVLTEARADRSRRVINHVDSPDLPFSWTLNTYRGCECGCSYCFARPTHELLGLSCGLDFETKIVTKHDAPELLRRELANRKWTGQPIAMSAVTDCYQPLERTLQITRRCLEVMVECRQPVTIVTKRKLVTRDIDLLVRLHEYRAVHVSLSVTTLDAALAASMEPRASAPADRLRAIRELADAGVPVGVMVAPVIPWINDREIPAILEASADAGATTAKWVMLRLPHEVKAIFLDWLRRTLPDRAARVEQEIRRMRDGRLYDARYGTRQRGESHFATQIERTFDVFARRYGLDQPHPPLSSESFCRPALDGQMGLFS